MFHLDCQDDTLDLFPRAGIMPVCGRCGATSSIACWDSWSETYVCAECVAHGGCGDERNGAYQLSGIGPGASEGFDDGEPTIDIFVCAAGETVQLETMASAAENHGGG